MSAEHHEPNYLIVFFALAALTALEVAIVFVPISKLIIGVALVALALVKAVLVALYFMHLRYEKFGLSLIALTPLLICTLLIFGLLPDLTDTARKTQTQDTVQVEMVEQVAGAAE